MKNIGLIILLSVMMTVESRLTASGNDITKRSTGKMQYRDDRIAACYPIDGKYVKQLSIKPGIQLFRDNEAVCGPELPESLNGLPFFRPNWEGVQHLKVERDGVILAITLSEESDDKSSRAADLKNRGFEKTDIPPFVLFGDLSGPKSEVWKKNAKRGEEIRLGRWAVIMTEIADGARKQLPNTDGKPLMNGTPAVLEPLEWELNDLQSGTKAFLDRKEHVIKNIPEKLAGNHFILSNFCSTRKVCRKDGIVFAITPSSDQLHYTQAKILEKLGFTKTDIPEFQIFGDEWPVWCSVYQKQMKKDERVDIRSVHVIKPVRTAWTIFLADTPKKRGKAGDQKGYRRNPFSPPLGQKYTVVARVTDPQSEFIHDPGMCVLPSGTIIAASPVWGRSGRGESDEIFHGPKYLNMSRSKDGGKTWERLPDLPYAEGTPFVVNGDLYMFTQPRQHSDVYFMRSRDEGSTWEGPVKVLEGKFWNCQTSMVKRDNKLYWVLDEVHQAMVPIAADLSKDLLDPEAWRRGEAVTAPPFPKEMRLRQMDPLPSPKDWVLEPNLMLVNDRMISICRVNPNNGHAPNFGAMWEVKDDEKGLRIEFENFIPWEGGHSKSCIVYDELTNLFWKATNLIMGFDTGRYGGGHQADRSTLTLYYSIDAITWLPAGCIALAPDGTQSFMYPSIDIDGDDLVVLSRSARESGYHHDADTSTFHRVKDFRDLVWN